MHDTTTHQAPAERITTLDLNDAHVIAIFRALKREVTALENKKPRTPGENATLMIAARQALARLAVVVPDELRGVLGLEASHE